MKDEGFYPAGTKRLRYCETVLIQRDLDMTLHYAFWMGREQINVNIACFLANQGT
jgi:hypothetical protein